MKDIVILKDYVKSDQLWENNPHIAFLPYLFLTVAAVFGYIFIAPFILPFESELILTLGSILGFIVPIGVMVVLVVRRNQDANLSASIGFVKRNNILYMITLGYANTLPGTVINVPSGGIAQAATVKNNLEVAKGVQDAEREIRERRAIKESYVAALTDVLDQLEKHPKKYYRKKKKGETGFHSTVNVKGVIDFLILEEPRIEKETKGHLWVSFKNGYGERKTIKLRNAYKGLKEDIEMQSI